MRIRRGTLPAMSPKLLVNEASRVHNTVVWLYTLRTWHETLGEQQQTIHVVDHASVTIRWPHHGGE